jgi:hypothetical protein
VLCGAQSGDDAFSGGGLSEADMATCGLSTGANQDRSRLNEATNLLNRYVNEQRIVPGS